MTNVVRRALVAFAQRSGDDEQTRLEKRAIFVIASACCLAGLVWTGMYVWVFGWGLTAGLPLVFVALVGASLVASHITGRHRIAVCTQILCVIQITAFIQWSIGGIFNSGFVLAWALCGPVAALVFFKPRQAIGCLGLYLVNVVITVLFDDYFSAHAQLVPRFASILFVTMNLCISAIVIFGFSVYFVDRARDQKRRADSLLLNILPKSIAPRLKHDRPDTIADDYPSASVLFADMVGSTPLFSGMAPDAVVDWINQAFTAFDRLTLKHGVEKIRTIGDNYMVAAGVPEKDPAHATKLVAFALDMVEAVNALPPRNGKRMQFRIGIHSGPLVAGVIGQVKFQYDLWGDTVNVASRMESHGEVGRVHISDTTYDLIRDVYTCVSRGPLLVKAKGEMKTWFVDGPC